jgi:murein DD-endopeptidase MepM/ murein hydrolase activator NlpD
VSDGELASELRRSRLLAQGLAVIAVGLVVVLAVMWPRHEAYPKLVDENMALKRELRQLELQVDEMDELIQRLRLYDAHLRSLTEPTGDHGPLPDSAFANSRVIEAYESVRALEDGMELRPEVVALDISEEPVALLPGDLRPAEAWAVAVTDRAETLLSVFEMVEPELNELMADLEDIRARSAALPSHWPARGSLTSGYGVRKSPVDRKLHFHSGVDIANTRGTPIHAAASGTVVKSGVSQGYGRMVEIDHGYGITTLYAHCTYLKVAVGNRVTKGDYIATMGSTGRATGPHLHFELRFDGHAVDPLQYLPR